MALSAADLQKRHLGLEGAPDPFPTLGGSPAPKRQTNGNGYNAAGASNGNGNGPDSNAAAAVDNSEDAFPSLGSSAAPAQALAKPASSMWASKPMVIKSGKGSSKPTPAGGLGRSGLPTASSHPHVDSFSIPASDLATGKTVQETIKKVQDQTGAMVESATQMQTGLRTFHIKAADPKRLAYARRMIERGLSKPVTIEVEVPVTTIGTIIGPKGATLKSITDSTQCKIDIPRRETLPAYEPATGNDDSDAEEEEPSVAISITGPSAACADAKAKILATISHKTSQTSTSIKTIPSSYYPFIAGPKGSRARQLEEDLGEGLVKVHVPPPAVWKALEKQGEDEAETTRDLSIKVKGDKEKVKVVVTDILRQFEELTDNLRELKISLPKRQHRFLVGGAADDILDQTQCIVELPPVDDSSDQCVIRGPQANLIPALTIVMDKANAIAVEMVDIAALHRINTSDPAHARNVLRYLQRSSKLRSIGEANGVKVYPPFASAVASGHVVIEVVGADKAQVSKAKEQVSAAVKSATPAKIATVTIDPLVHSLLIGKKGNKIAQFESAHNVTTVFPPNGEESSDVLLVYIGEGNGKDAIAAASAALNELAKDAADIKTETLAVDKKFHRAIIGPQGTVLNVLIGDNLVKVQIDEDVVIRGPSGEVDRVKKQIEQIVEDAKNDDIINGHTAEFTVDKKHVPHLVGQGGSTINKLRETLGVRVNFDDDKGKVQCKIVGRKEAVEEAKKRLQAQIEKLQDETSETIKIKREIQPALIGAGGKYAIRLEEKYGVKLSFPRDKESDEVSIRGGRKGVASAKAELLEAAAYEAESRQSATFTVPTRAVSQIVGKSGATINDIKDETGAQIDIDKTPENGKTTITLRGDKKAIAAAKAAILAVADSVGEETTVEFEIERKFHRTLIGQGGNRLRETIATAGGPTEGFKQAGLVTFPKGDDSDTVKLRGDKAVVAKIKAELEKQVATLRETKVVGVVVSKDQHASKIGRGGMALNALQRDTGAVIHFPGSRQYGSVGDIENTLPEDTDAADIVKVIGTDAAIAKATESLQTITARPERENRGERNGGGGGGNSSEPTRTIAIPAKYYFAIADQPIVRQQIRGTGAYLVQPQAPARPVHASSANDGAAKSARIDVDADEGGAQEGEWEVRDNYAGASDDDLEWVIRGKEDALDRAEKVLQDARERAEKADKVGLLTGLPRNVFPRIIGSKGSTIQRLRAETGADIQVGRDDDLITITGDAESVEQAKDAILTIVRGGRY